jgi:hypothetical protein
MSSPEEIRRPAGSDPRAAEAFVDELSENRPSTQSRQDLDYTTARPIRSLERAHAVLVSEWLRGKGGRLQLGADYAGTDNINGTLKRLGITRRQFERAVDCLCSRRCAYLETDGRGHLFLCAGKGER